MFAALRNFFKSLKFRIYIFLLIFAVIPSVVIRVGVICAYENYSAETRMNDIISQIRLLNSQITRNDYLNDTESEAITAHIEQLGSVYDIRIILVNDSFQAVTDTYNRIVGKDVISSEILTAYNEARTVREYNRKESYIRIAVPIYREVPVQGDRNTDSSNSSTRTTQVCGVALVNGSSDFMTEDLNHMIQWAFILQLITYVIVVVGGFLLANRLVKPLHQLASSIQEVKEGYTSDFTAVSKYQEVQEISDACSEMLGRLKLLDESRQEFVSNVSHELKTPLTSMKVLADSLNSMENVPAELYSEFMGDITNEIDRENKIINDLLSLVRLDKSAGELNISNVNINDLLNLLMKRLKPIAARQEVDLVLESFRPVTAEVDETKLTLALSNLIENAIKYNKPKGFVHVSLNADHKNFFVSVMDNGIGIPEDAQAHIFERFYRVDKSHSRAIGGTGLGLAITRNIIIMHRGAIKVHSIEGEGTTFQVRIPLTYVAKTER